MNAEAMSQTERELYASELAVIVTLLGCMARKYLRDEPQQTIPMDTVHEWAMAADAFLKGYGYAAADRQLIRVAATRFLEACAQLEVKPRLNLLSFAVDNARREFPTDGGAA